jgi:hypothetical protein
VVRQFGWVMPDLEMGRIADLRQKHPFTAFGRSHPCGDMDQQGTLEDG